MSSKPKLVFFGNERLATAAPTTAPTLQALVHAGYDVKAVAASYTEGVSRSKRPLEIVEVAHAYHIPVLIDKPGELIDKLKNLGAEAGVLVAYGRLVPQQIMDLFPKGIINIHPSLLPKLRGPTPVETAILNGERQTGVSLMRLSAEMDAGPVYVQQKVELAGSENKFQLAEKLLNIGCQLLRDNLDGILAGSLKPRPQDETEVTFSRLLTKAMGKTDFSEPADAIERQVRAFLGFPKTRAVVHGHEIVITKARVAKSQTDGALVITCQPGFLEIVELIAPSGKTMTSRDFMRGYLR
ncbi:MAG TPA: methionyl-tRNA formyltransferase [Candidatus Saccharimonadales bacterium]|nr:methionyl-tRNA formyltransferase [Candidatus Saccharimonadales bacterium]